MFLCLSLVFPFIRSDLPRLLNCVYVVQNKMKSLSLLFAPFTFKSKDIQMLLIICRLVLTRIE
jgi:hypothetical protein